MKVIAFIPARLGSRRLPNKIIKTMFGLPMVEHVVRRVKYSKIFSKIILVSNNKLIKKYIKSKNINIVISKKKHLNGTSRASEVSKKFQYSLAAILFGDEPFINPKKIKLIMNKVKNKINVEYDLINVVTNINSNDFKSKSVVKCVINKKGFIIDYFRTNKKISKKYKVFKSSGVFIFKKNTLENYNNLIFSKREKRTSIEQFRFLDNKLKIKSLFVNGINPSINTIQEFNDTINSVKKNKNELALIKKLNRL